MRVIFAGTPDFAARALAAIAEAGHAIPLVLTQPDRPAGRGQRLAESPVKRWAATHGFPLYQPLQLRTDDQQAPLLAVAADVMVVAAYGLILPQQVLDHPAHGCLNIHASLLPRWRGAAPIQRALLAGDARTGICIMQMDAGLDTGPVISRYLVDITERDSAGTLHDKLAEAGAAAIIEALATLAREGALAATPQETEGITYAPKITRDEARIDWSRSAADIARQVRAFDPAPGAFTSIAGATLKVWSARPAAPAVERLSALTADRSSTPTADRLSTPIPAAAAERLADGQLAFTGGALIAGCGDGDAIILEQLQSAGARRLSGIEWARGRPDLAAGRTLRLAT